MAGTEISSYQPARNWGFPITTWMDFEGHPSPVNLSDATAAPTNMKDCYGLNCVPSKFICWRPKSHNLRIWLYLDRPFKEALKLKWGYGAPGWLSPLRVWLQLRSWSHGSRVWAPHWALCWQLGAWTLLQILCFPLSLPLSHLCSVCLLNMSRKSQKNF